MQKEEGVGKERGRAGNREVVRPVACWRVNFSVSVVSVFVISLNK